MFSRVEKITNKKYLSYKINEDKVMCIETMQAFTCRYSIMHSSFATGKSNGQVYLTTVQLIPL